MKGLSINKKLQKIYLADNQFNDDQEVLESVKDCMMKNKELGRYDFKHNNIGNEGIQFFTELLPEAPHVFEIEISERVSKEALAEFREKLAANKPKKKKKGGKKKKKKKK